MASVPPSPLLEVSKPVTSVVPTRPPKLPAYTPNTPLLFAVAGPTTSVLAIRPLDSALIPWIALESALVTLFTVVCAYPAAEAAAKVPKVPLLSVSKPLTVVRAATPPWLCAKTPAPVLPLAVAGPITSVVARPSVLWEEAKMPSPPLPLAACTFSTVVAA